MCRNEIRKSDKYVLLWRIERATFSGVQAESKPHADVDIEYVYVTYTANNVLKLIKTLRIGEGWFIEIRIRSKSR